MKHMGSNLRKSGLWDKLSNLIFCITGIEYSIRFRMIYDTSQSRKRQSYSGGLNRYSHKSFILRKTQLNQLFNH